MEAIDLAYTWCDSADERWNAKRKAAAESVGLPTDAEASLSCRYAANDELRYSLRSAELNVPWIRTVFLVIDDDIAPPAWLRTDHPRLRVVRLGEIMPCPDKPCFCSDSIEHRLAFAPGLSERFIYSNDDCMFYRPLSPRFFFAKDGYPIFRFGGVRDADGSGPFHTYRRNLANAERLVRAAYPCIGRQLGEALKRNPHHCVDAYRKSDVQEAYARYRDEIEPMFDYPFRRDANVQRLVYAYDAIARGRGHFRLARFRVQEGRPWYKRLLRPGYADTLSFVREKWKTGPAQLRRWRPGAFCFNDTAGISDGDRAWVRDVYERLFPRKSSFET
jgi:hypothetical protein